MVTQPSHRAVMDGPCTFPLLNYSITFTPLSVVINKSNGHVRIVTTWDRAEMGARTGPAGISLVKLSTKILWQNWWTDGIRTRLFGNTLTFLMVLCVKRRNGKKTIGKYCHGISHSRTIAQVPAVRGPRSVNAQPPSNDVNARQNSQTFNEEKQRTFSVHNQAEVFMVVSHRFENLEAERGRQQERSRRADYI